MRLKSNVECCKFFVWMRLRLIDFLIILVLWVIDGLISFGVNFKIEFLLNFVVRWFFGNFVWYFVICGKWILSLLCLGFIVLMWIVFCGGCGGVIIGLVVKLNGIFKMLVYLILNLFFLFRLYDCFLSVLLIICL